MSGGSYDYMYHRVDAEYVGRMFDRELDEMMRDLVDVLHDVEWWQSGDIGEERYRDTVEKFKEKWFGTRDENLRDRLAQWIDEAKKEILR